MLENMKAMVLAAGLGTRMRPLTAHRPKPLIDVAGKPLLEYAFDLLREAGIRDVIVNRHYLADHILEYVQRVTGLEVRSIYEQHLLETGGGLKNALPLLGREPFFALNSDTICLSAAHKPVLAQLYKAWQAGEHDIVMLFMPRGKAQGYAGRGDFIVDEASGRFRRLKKEDEAAPAYVFTGVQLLHPRIFEGTPEGAFSMNAIYERYCVQADGWFNARIGCVIHEGDWLHVGDPPARDAAEAFVKQRLTG